MRRRGFSLLELMLALAVTTLVIAGLTQMVLSAAHTQTVSARVGVAQDGVRSAVEFLTRDIMSAAVGAASGVMWNGTELALPGGNLVYAIHVTDSTVGPDRLDLVLVSTTAPYAQLAATYLPSATLVTMGPAGAANPLISAPGILQVSDLSSAVLLRATATGVDGNGCPTATVVPSAVGMPLAAYPAGAWVFQSRIVTYSVVTTALATTPPTTYPVLYFDPDGPGVAAAEPLAEGIEDFQVALGIDKDGDGLVNPLESTAVDGDEWVFNVAGEAMPATLANLRSVRITLVSRTTTADVGARGQRPAAENHPGAAAVDGYPRRVLRSEIAVRNFNL